LRGMSEKKGRREDLRWTRPNIANIRNSTGMRVKAKRVSTRGPQVPMLVEQQLGDAWDGDGWLLVGEW
jgi:hypothetical protein